MDNFVSPSLEQVINALHLIVPLLEKTGHRWIITGGFACYVYGVDRALSDIDIDVDCAHDDLAFVTLLNDLQDYITQPLMHLHSDDYDNYNVEATYDGVILDMCPGDNLKLFDPATGGYERAYKTGFPIATKITFHGFNLPLLSKDRIITQKQQLQRPVDAFDIAALQKIL